MRSALYEGMLMHARRTPRRNVFRYQVCYFLIDGSLACVVAELNNTFGERLPEVLRGPGLRYEQRKRLTTPSRSPATRSGRVSTSATTTTVSGR